MAGTKRQLYNGTWELCVSLGSDLKGERIREYAYTEEPCSDKEADIQLAELVVNTARNNGYGSKTLIKDFIPYWQKHHADEQLRNKTVSRYDDLLERVEEFLGRFTLSEIIKKPTLLKDFYAALQKDGVRKDGKKGGLSILTIRHHHAVISSMFTSALAWNMVKENPCLRIKPPKEKRKDKKKKKNNFFTIDQAKEFLQALNELSIEEFKYKVMVFLDIFTGFRRSEIMGLEWPDFKLSKNSVTINRTSQYTVEIGIYEDDTKNDGSERTSIFPETVTAMLKEYRKHWDLQKSKVGDKWIETDRLFVQWNGAPMHPDTISKWFAKFIKKNNLPHVTYHGLRHTYGSILLAMGMDLQSVADILGHSSIQMLVQTYGHNVVKGGNKKAAELMSEALLKKSEIVPEQELVLDEQTSILPDYLPEDVKLLIEKLMSNYAPVSKIG